MTTITTTTTTTAAATGHYTLLSNSKLTNLNRLHSGTKPSELVRHAGLLLERIAASDALDGSGHFARITLAILKASRAVLQSMKTLGDVGESRGKAVERHILDQTGRLVSVESILRPIVRYALTAKRASEIRQPPPLLLTTASTSSNSTYPTVSISQIEAKAALEICLYAQECLSIVGYLEGLKVARDIYSNNSGEIAAVVSSHIEWLLPQCLYIFPGTSRWEPLCPHQCLLEALCTESQAMEPTHNADILKWACEVASTVNCQCTNEKDAIEGEKVNLKGYYSSDVKKNLTILEGCGRALLLLFGGGKERVLSTFKFKQSLRTDLLYNVLNLLAMPAWKRSDQLQDFQLDIFVSLKDVFSQLNDYTGISLRVVDTLVHHIDDCTRPPHRRLNAIDVCTAFVHKNPRAECDDDDHRTYDESCKNAVEYIGWEGTGESSSLPTVFIEVFRAALVRRLDDPSNEVCQSATELLECL